MLFLAIFGMIWYNTMVSKLSNRKDLNYEKNSVEKLCSFDRTKGR